MEYVQTDLARKTTGPAMSSGCPSLPKQVREIIPSLLVASERSSLLMSVAIVPGRTAFARIPYFPNATAQLCIKERIPATRSEYGRSKRRDEWNTFGRSIMTAQEDA